MKFTTQYPEQASQLDFRPVGGGEKSSTSREPLQSWKEIAAELGRGVRTVQRWERTLQLPVHRLGKGLRSPVFAFKDEIRLWMRTRADDPREDHRQNDNGLERRQAKAGGLITGSRLFKEMSPPNESRPRIRSEAEARIVESVRGLFAVSPLLPKQQVCAECNSPMQPLDGEFQFYACKKRWKISLPFCPACDLGVLSAMRPLRQVH